MKHKYERHRFLSNAEPSSFLNGLFVPGCAASRTAHFVDVTLIANVYVCKDLRSEGRVKNDTSLRAPFIV